MQAIAEQYREDYTEGQIESWMKVENQREIVEQKATRKERKRQERVNRQHLDNALAYKQLWKRFTRQETLYDLACRYNFRRSLLARYSRCNL